MNADRRGYEADTNMGLISNLFPNVMAIFAPGCGLDPRESAFMRG